MKNCLNNKKAKNKLILLLLSVHIMPDAMLTFAAAALQQAGFTGCGQVNSTQDGAANTQWMQM